MELSVSHILSMVGVGLAVGSLAYTAARYRSDKLERKLKAALEKAETDKKQDIESAVQQERQRSTQAQLDKHEASCDLRYKEIQKDLGDMREAMNKGFERVYDKLEGRETA